jgi:hypothetical protein
VSTATQGRSRNSDTRARLPPRFRSRKVAPLARGVAQKFGIDAIQRAFLEGVLAELHREPQALIRARWRLEQRLVGHHIAQAPPGSPRRIRSSQITSAKRFSMRRNWRTPVIANREQQAAEGRPLGEGSAEAMGILLEAHQMWCVFRRKRGDHPHRAANASPTSSVQPAGPAAIAGRLANGSSIGGPVPTRPPGKALLPSRSAIGPAPACCGDCAEPSKPWPKVG